MSPQDGIMKISGMESTTKGRKLKNPLITAEGAEETLMRSLCALCGFAKCAFDSDDGYLSLTVGSPNSIHVCRMSLLLIAAFAFAIA